MRADQVEGKTAHCGAFTKPGDVQNATLPLGPPANNGSPTFTRLPLAGNQEIDAIPPAQCGLAVDRRGETRPSGSGCDSSAVKVSGLAQSIYLPLVIR